MSRLSQTSLMLAMFLLVDKAIAILRQVLIANEFEFSKELDVFNVANNVPDLLFALISGGALAMAFLPVLSEVLNLNGRREAWGLFSRVANLAFIATGLIAIVVAILADPIVRSEIGVAPGFDESQKQLVVNLMRLNLVATLIFSISGLVMSALQANQHFVLPALAPILYNLGQIFGVLILAPSEGKVIAGFQLPAFGLGINGLVYGVILGAALHLAIQIPGLIRYQFRWVPAIDLGNPLVRKVLRVMGPRLGTMLAIQLTFIVRDNLASRLQEGSVSALTYGWMIMQVPETVIGTAIGIAILPTLSELATRQEMGTFRATIDRAVRLLTALTIPVAIVLAFSIQPLLDLAFNLAPEKIEMLLWATRAFLVGLAGQCLLEVAVRSFYSRQDALTPLFTAAGNLVLYTLLGILFYQSLGAAGIALGDAIAFTAQAVILLIILSRSLHFQYKIQSSLLRGAGAGVAAALISWLLFPLLLGILPDALASILTMAAAALVAVPIILPDLRLLLRL